MLPNLRFFQFGAATLAAGLACGGEHPSGTTSSILEITIATSGDEPDTDGYTVQVDSSPARVVQPAGVIQHRDVSPGDHKVYVGGVAENCTVEGANPRSINVLTEGTTSLTIQITCSAPNGSLLVITRTQGPAPFPPGLKLVVDDVERASIDTGLVVLANLSRGSHVVQLRGLASHCSTHGNPRTVSVRAHETTRMEFTLICLGSHGILEIMTTPIGYQNPADFAYSLDGGPPAPLSSSGSTSLTVNAGRHSVELLKVPPNCRVTAPNPILVTIPAGGRGRLVIHVVCERFAPGSLVVSVTTTGTAAVDEFQLMVNGDNFHVQPDDRLIITDLQPGNHYVALTGVSPDCQINGEGNRLVFVPVGAATNVEFVVTCTGGG